MAVPVEPIRIMEVPADAAGPLRFPIDALVDPINYAHRFDELMSSGHSWIAVCCAGILGPFLVVTIEVSKTTTAGSSRVSFSGPERRVLEDNWLLARGQT